MVRQHLYRVGKDGGRTIAVSDSLKGSAWLPLLEQQLDLLASSSLTVSAYDQYPLGRGLVISCRTPDPFGWEGGCLCHQLVFDDPADAIALMSLRPLPDSLFIKRYHEKESGTDSLPDLPVASLARPDEMKSCFHALDMLFGREETLLARFLGVLTLCARDKRQGVRIAVSESPEKVSEAGWKAMELLLSCLPPEDGVRLTFCTLRPADEPLFAGSVSFTPDDGRITHLSTQDILLDLTAHQITPPFGLSLPDPNQYIALARALLAHDPACTSGQSGHLSASVGVDSLRMDVPPFEEGMSLSQYFEHWRSELESRRAMLTDEAFRTFAAREWPKMLSNMVSASELMDNPDFLEQMTGILTVIRREKPDNPLSPDDETLADLVTLLLDSIRWRQINLADARSARLLRTVTAYGQVIGETHCEADCLLACRIIHRLLTAPLSVHESLREMARLESLSSARFEALQDCLQQYVQHRLIGGIAAIDETLAAAAMLAFAKFSDNVPDLRLADKLTERIEAQSGAKAARRFQEMMDRLRRHLRSSRPGGMHRRDLKLFLLICGALLLIIIGISAWFFLLN